MKTVQLLRNCYFLQEKNINLKFFDLTHRMSDVNVDADRFDQILTYAVLNTVKQS